MSGYHVFPLNDLIEHDTSVMDACVCGPDVEFVSGGYVATHHALDGREHAEHDHDQDACPTCVTRPR